MVAAKQNESNESTESEASTQEAAPETKKDAPTHAAPSEYKDLPKGKDGGPATIDNPVVEKKSRR